MMTDPRSPMKTCSGRCDLKGEIKRIDWDLLKWIDWDSRVCNLANSSVQYVDGKKKGGEGCDREPYSNWCVCIYTTERCNLRKDHEGRIKIKWNVDEGHMGRTYLSNGTIDQQRWGIRVSEEKYGQWPADGPFLGVRICDTWSVWTRSYVIRGHFNRILIQN